LVLVEGKQKYWWVDMDSSLVGFRKETGVTENQGYVYIQSNLPKTDPLYTGNLDKRKINFGTELFPM
jgi:hypothetical protein